MRKNITFFIVITILCVCICVILRCLYQKPEKTYGEFPFELKFDRQGNEEVVKDVIICKYEGVAYNTGNGVVREWSEQLSSGAERIILWEGYNKKGERQQLYYVHEQAGCLMGDPDYKIGNKYYFSNVALETFCFDGTIDTRLLGEKKLFNKFGIRILSWKCAPPIENMFK